MYNILYICNYMLEDIIKQRNNKCVFSQAANNKVIGIAKSLHANNCSVTIISHALMNNRTCKYYKGFKSTLNENLYYISILDIPLLNIISLIVNTFKKIKELNKNNNIDYILFYNYKPETAFSALLCKLFLKIPIIIDYEDGYFALKSINRIKRCVFNFVEKIVSKFIDGAILVNSELIYRIKTKRYYIIRGIINDNILERAKCINKNICKNKKPILMYCGSLDEERGIKILLESLKYIKDDFKLLISGTGPLIKDVMNYKDIRIKYIGFIKNYDELIDLMIKSDILINTQLSNINFGTASFPSKIFEYLSTGNLIISSNVADIESFLSDSIYIYKDDSPKLLAEVIHKALNNKCLNNEFKNNIRIIQSQYNYKNIGANIVKTLFI